ncbi:helix-turn-helix domain-containing protein [Lacisediminihabitans sp. H27-G8]|uniref:helix-turn-helix domain-containing protein n=1 Tax=Lacisediminihabitans sp. H27-G8 TaxID=3111909 RepID=UPI0038FD008F
MTTTINISWHLRTLLAEHGIYQTTHVVPLLKEHGVHLSREQVYRLVTQTPQRLNMEVLAALCSILSCTPNDLITLAAEEAASPRRAATNGKRSTVPPPQPPTKTTLRRPGNQ